VATIRHVATSWAGQVFAAAEFETHVHVWDLELERRLSSFAASLDFGGSRLAVTTDGRHCAVAAYKVHGVGYYSVRDGAEVWRRTDLKKIQRVRFSLDDKVLYCCFDDRPCHLLDRHTGATISALRSVRESWESPYDPVALHDKKNLELWGSQGCRVAVVQRTTFAVLSAAFAPGLFCISESGGAVRCLDVQSGREVWTYVPPVNAHVLELGYDEQAGAFFGVEWPYDPGGPKRLIRLDPCDGKRKVVVNLGVPAEAAFCMRGSRLITSAGKVLDVATGRVVAGLPLEH
jgi:WD40 repeat protein